MLSHRTLLEDAHILNFIAPCGRFKCVILRHVGLQQKPSFTSLLLFFQAWLWSRDPAFNGVLHSLRVEDGRQLTGKSPASPRIILQLPFNDTGDSTAFGPGSAYSCEADVVVRA